MPTCLECGETIERGMYCALHRLESGSTLGYVYEDLTERRRPTRGDDDDGPDVDKPEKSDRGTLRGE